VEFEGGPTACVEVNYLSKYPGARWAVYGEHGTLINDAAGWDRLKIFWADRGVEEHLPARQGNPAVIHSSFAQAIRGKGRPAVSPESVRRTMRLLDACLVSAREGRSVNL